MAKKILKSKLPMLSVVVPVYNEQENLPALFNRLISVLDSLNRPYEIIFTNDGSLDNSLCVLQDCFNQRPEIVRIIDFFGNFVQHMAIIAAF